MNPAFLDNMSWEMAEVYGAITDQILINLARHFPFYDAGDPLPESAFVYQAKMLAQMGQINKETVRIIRNGLDEADTALRNSLEQAVIDAVKKAQPELLEAVKKGVFAMPENPAVTPNQMRAFKLYYEQAAQKLNLVNTVMLESTQSAYQQAVTNVVAEIELSDRMNRTQLALDTAAGEVITGVSSWNQALRHATDRLKEGGIVGFVDHAGRQWSAEAYTAMDIRTTMFNTARAATWEVNQSFGNDLYLVSYHDGARPLCYPWQNKVISSTNNARVVTDLDGNTVEVIAQSSTSYGEPAGLFGINCKHYPIPFIPGVSVADGHPQSKEDNDRTYEESQEQRRLERKLREEKRDLMMAKAQGAPQEEIDRLQAKCRKSSEDIDDFCKETGRARHRDREAVYTKREFPDKDKYDVSQFERQQKELVDKYYADGGAQQNYSFGQMTPNTPVEPGTPTPAAPDIPKAAPPSTAAPSTPVAEANQEPAAALHDSLADAYEYHRTANGLTSVPYDPNSELQFITEDLSRLGEESQKTVSETIGDLVKKYDTPLTSVQTMDKQETLMNHNAFASVTHNYKTDTASMSINPVKCGNNEKMVKRLFELRDSGYCAYVPDEYVDRYVYTHEFGHSLMNFADNISGKNFVGANYAKLRSVREQVAGIYKEYTEKIGMLEAAKREAEKAFINDLSPEAGETARGIIKQIKELKISNYSLTDVDEFFAESFVYTEYGGVANEYAVRVRNIIDANFRR